MGAAEGGGSSGRLEKATFAGGCFWCIEASFEGLRGVKKVVSGYTGGWKKDPTYEEVSSGTTGHAESVQVLFDPSLISYEELLEVFWRHIDPTDPGGQFADRGSQYRTVIFYHNEQQKTSAERSRASLERSGRFSKPIVTTIEPAAEFYKAEENHQGYRRKNPDRYEFYLYASGRGSFIQGVWGSGDEPDRTGHEGETFKRPSPEELRKRLTPLQYEVTQKAATEVPFDNEFWDNKGEGIYVDVVSGEPLFSSLDKYDSGSGWPSFTGPLEPQNIVEVEDRSHLMVRTELRSRLGGSHLGHLFPDGPPPTRLRYCVNSASLRFIPAEDLEKEGYGRYRRLFEDRPIAGLDVK